jgi:glycosyltransferase involved in cell wall biosynthesis
MNVIIGTPCFDGRCDVYFASSIIETVRQSPSDITVYPIFLAHDALIQRARNDLISIAIESNVDALVFVDSDMEFSPQWIFKLLSYEEDVVGGTARKKTDEAELYNINTQNLDIEENGLIKVNSLGTGFLKLSKKALQSLWNISPEYINEGKKARMIFDVQVIDGELFSEDNVMCRKLRELGYDIWLDPNMCCNHIGPKVYMGNFMDFRDRLLTIERAA